MGRAQPGKGFEAPLRGFVAERARAVMGTDSAITLDGQSRVAMGITTYALSRRASPPSKQSRGETRSSLGAMERAGNARCDYASENHGGPDRQDRLDRVRIHRRRP